MAESSTINFSLITSLFSTKSYIFYLLHISCQSAAKKKKEFELNKADNSKFPILQLKS